METYLKALDLESFLLSIGCMMALVCVGLAFMTRTFYKLELKFASKDQPPKKPSYGYLLWFGAVFMLMGVLPYNAKVRDLNRTPKEVIQGEIVEVDTVAGEALLRISTANNRLIKVVRPRSSSWPTTVGPVQVELFHHAGQEFVSKVKSQPET
jgi:hypothetical protein